jgi:hypothetical protein
VAHTMNTVEPVPSRHTEPEQIAMAALLVGCLLMETGAPGPGRRV